MSDIPVMAAEPFGPPMPVYYRFREVRYSPGADEYGDPLPGSSIALVLEQCPVERFTPTGAWIHTRYGLKFVCDDWAKRYALPTVAEAKGSYRARKRRQRRLLENQLRVADEGLAIMERWPDDDTQYSRFGRWIG